MSLFTRKPEPPQGGGKDQLRRALRARDAKGPYAIGQLRDELQIGSEALHSFANGGQLPDEKLVGLATFLYAGHSRYDVANDALVPTRNIDPVSAPVHPARPPQIVMVSLSHTELAAVTEAASREMISIADYVRRSAVKAAERRARLGVI